VFAMMKDYTKINLTGLSTIGLTAFIAELRQELKAYENLYDLQVPITGLTREQFNQFLDIYYDNKKLYLRLTWKTLYTYKI
jgi:hypothetical protein